MLETWLRESKVRLPATSQLCFSSLIFVDYVVILYDGFFADLFSRLCCASVLYTAQSLSARARFAGPVRIPLRPCLFLLVSRCSCGTTVRNAHCAYRPATSAFCLRHVIGLPSSPTDNTSGIFCHVRRFIRHAVDNSRVILVNVEKYTQVITIVVL